MSLVRATRLQNYNIVEAVDATQVRAYNQIPNDSRAKNGQFGTPVPVAELMASMFTFDPEHQEVRLLDAGAGVGSLTAAFVAVACTAPSRPVSIHVTAYEAELLFIDPLRESLEACRAQCKKYSIGFEYEVVAKDFIETTVTSLMRQRDLFIGTNSVGFNYAIQNPPYRKISVNSEHRRLLSKLGIEVSNLYAAFVALTIRTLDKGGQLVAITPRSFCNGPYFKSFRSDFLKRVSLRRLHVFDSRSKVFGGDNVLQENIIVSAVIGSGRPETVMITSSSGDRDGDEVYRVVPYSRVVPPGAPVPFIHLITDGKAEWVVQEMSRFAHSLADIGVEVSTGRVVDFRAKNLLRMEPDDEGFPLIYPVHLRDGGTIWPLRSKKPNALADLAGVEKLLVPPGIYVLIKRFSSKEQRRRIDAAIYDSAKVAPGKNVGFENHINYIHEGGEGLDPQFAAGLAIYLNSSVVDLYFRLFSGHTQVNAADLRVFPFPAREELLRLGRAAQLRTGLGQDELDELVRDELMRKRNAEVDPVALHKKVGEASQVLKELGFPKAQTNDRSGLTLLALLNLRADTSWSEATAPMRGITEMMDYFAEHYGRRYAPNSRETVRRQTIHQFVDAGLVRRNPDDPSRAVNSKNNVYQVIPEAVAMLKMFGTDGWESAKQGYLKNIKTLKSTYAQPRQMARIPIVINNDRERRGAGFYSLRRSRVTVP